MRAAAQHAPASVAYSVDLGGLLRGVDGEIQSTVRRAAGLLGAAAHGARVLEASPSFPADVHQTFLTLRHARLVESVGGGPKEPVGWMVGAVKSEIMWEVAAGLGTLRACRTRSVLVQYLRP